MAVRPQTRLERAAYPVPFVFLDRSIRTRARKCTRGSFTSQVQRKCVMRLRVGPDARPILLGNQVFQPTKSFSQPSLWATKSWPTANQVLANVRSFFRRRVLASWSDAQATIVPWRVCDDAVTK